MKKQSNKLFVLLVFAVLFGVVSGCKFWAETSGGDTNNKGGSNEKPLTNSNVKKASENDEKMAKNGLAGNIVGTWEGNPDGEENITMTFKENGSIVIVTDDGEEKSTVDAKYRIIDEKTVEIEFEDGKTSKITDIKINGDTMQAKGKNSRPATFKRGGEHKNDSENSSDDDS